MLHLFKNKRQVLKGLSPREEKQRINVRWNSALFFQLALVVNILLAIVIIESDWKLSEEEFAYKSKKEWGKDEPMIANLIIDLPKPIVKDIEPPKPRAQKPAPTVTSITPVSNEIVTAETEVPTAEPDNSASLPEIPIAANIPSKPKSLLQVEEIPLFPGCESLGSKEERMACFQQGIQKYIARKFNVDKFSEKYPGQKKRITVQFSIDVNGNVTNIKSSSPGGQDLMDEATRVVSGLPQMIPGKMNNKPVEVFYTLPINLVIEY